MTYRGSCKIALRILLATFLRHPVDTRQSRYTVHLRICMSQCHMPCQGKHLIYKVYKKILTLRCHMTALIPTIVFRVIGVLGLINKVTYKLIPGKGREIEYAFLQKKLLLTEANA